MSPEEALELLVEQGIVEDPAMYEYEQPCDGCGFDTCICASPDYIERMGLWDM